MSLFAVKYNHKTSINTNHISLLLKTLAIIIFTSSTIVNIAHAFKNITPISIDNLSRPSIIENISISTEGDFMVALITPNGEDKQAISVWDLNNLKKAPLITRAPKDIDFLRVSALKSGNIIVYARKKWSGNIGMCGGEGKKIGTTKTYISKIFIVDSKLKKFDALDLSSKNAKSSEISDFCSSIFSTTDVLSLLPLEKNKIMVSIVDNRNYQVKIYKYDLKKRKSQFLFKRSSEQRSTTLINKNDGTYDGESLITAKGKSYIQTLWIRDPDTKKMKTFDNLRYDKTKTRESTNFVAYDKKTKKYLLASDRFSNFSKIYSYDPKTGKIDMDALYSNPNFSVNNVVRGNLKENDEEIIGYNLAGKYYKTIWVDDLFKPLQASLDKSFPDKHVAIIDYDINIKYLLFAVYAPNYPVEYYVLIDKSKAVKIGSSKPWLKGKDLSQTKFVYYTARDGLKIPALLTLPKGYVKGSSKLKTVIHPHGGPWSREALGSVSGWTQYFASRGFAVLQPQYRGSEGLGKELWLKGDKNWGKTMQDDKDDGAKWLIDSGIADPKKVIMFGYSYGGYAAIAAAVRNDNIYRCTLAGAGVADIKTLGTGFFTGSRFSRFYQGRTLKGYNPIEHVDEASIPTLLFTGDRDVRVPPFHSKRFYAGIKDKVYAKLVWIPDMPHSNPWTVEQKKLVYHTIEDFLVDPKGCNLKIPSAPQATQTTSLTKSKIKKVKKTKK